MSASGETQRTPRREATPASDAAEPKAKAPVRQRDSLENHPEYQKAFNSRPKILRTPEHKRVSLSMDPGDVRGNDRAAYSRASKSRPMSGMTFKLNSYINLTHAGFYSRLYVLL